MTPEVVFVPKHTLEYDSPSLLEIQNRAELVRQAIVEDEEACQKELSKMWREMVAGADPALRSLIDESMQQKYFVKNYFIALQAAINERLAAHFLPAVDPSFDSPSATVFAEREQLLAGASRVDHDACMREIQRRWQEKTCTMSLEMLALVSGEMQQKFVEKLYYDVLKARVFVQRKCDSSASVGPFESLVDPGFDGLSLIHI